MGQFWPMTEPPRHLHALARELAAKAWASNWALIDLQLSPLGLAAIEALVPKAGEVIVDVGCGAGQSVMQLAELVGTDGRVVGVDVAPSLLKIAGDRCADLNQVHLIEGDASILGLPDGTIDCFYSRFGVMGFAEPIAAFANFHRMLKPAGRLAFACWRSLEENELDFLPLNAAGLEDRVDRTPFSFEASDHIRATLEAAGFKQITIRAHDELVSSGDLEAMATVLLSVGPLGRVLRESPNLRLAAEPRVRAALAVQGDPSHVALNAATWIVSARA